MAHHDKPRLTGFRSSPRQGSPSFSCLSGSFLCSITQLDSSSQSRSYPSWFDTSESGLIDAERLDARTGEGCSGCPDSIGMQIITSKPEFPSIPSPVTLDRLGSIALASWIHANQLRVKKEIESECKTEGATE